jgi:hypothetical protein
MSCFKTFDSGWCSFCGTDMFRVLVESPLHQRIAICDRCVVSNCDGLGALPPYYAPEYLPGVEELVTRLEASAHQHDERCSFCDATRSAVLVSGLRGSVCERCLARCTRVVVSGLPPCDLDGSLTDAFPAVTIDHSMLDEPSMVEGYSKADELDAFVGKTWRDSSSQLLLRHASLPIYAGDTLFRVLLPAYLRYLLHEQQQFGVMPEHVGGELGGHRNSRHKFERRVALLTTTQRTTIRAVLEELAKNPHFTDAMTPALAAWI